MRRIVHYYPAAMGNSGVTFALWSWARAQDGGGIRSARDACTRRHDTGADVAFVSKENAVGPDDDGDSHRGGHGMTLRPSSL